MSKSGMGALLFEDAHQTFLKPLTRRASGFRVLGFRALGFRALGLYGFRDFKASEAIMASLVLGFRVFWGF